MARSLVTSAFLHFALLLSLACAGLWEPERQIICSFWIPLSRHAPEFQREITMAPVREVLGGANSGSTTATLTVAQFCGSYRPQNLMDLHATYVYWSVFIIQQNFKPAYSMPGIKCVVRFNIQKDGTITDPKILTSSGRSDMDQTALRALTATGKVMPLYDGYTKPFMEAEVTFDFEKAQ